MAKRKRRSFGKLLRGAVKDVVMPTSMGLGIAIGGCGGSTDKADVPTWAVMPPADAAADHRDGYAILPPTKDAAAERRDGYAIMPPTKDAAADHRDGYAIMPPMKDAAPDTRDTRPDVPIYAIMPIRRDAGDDATAPDAESVKQDAKPDTKPLPKDTGSIYAIMPLAVLPPRG